MNTSTLRARHHEPPRQWAADVFDRVTDALAAAMSAAYRRAHSAEAIANDAKARETGR